MQALYYKRRMLVPRLEPKFSERLFVLDYETVFTKKDDLYTVSHDSMDVNEGENLLNGENPNLRSLKNEEGYELSFLYEGVKKIELQEVRVYALLNLFNKKFLTERLVKQTLTDIFSKDI